ncbi:hypothetical protein TrLO_g7927 [Triparma laevis f. longispina]|uniref:Uncharacterized protein n=1 Tax=Triparma laevis f. longispina TaxID=1714387 RepID=A0A9W7KVZ1_9STRA|nr:hypothetical protein TrLO_g7927 [Triparma laevis f. longispina]
MLLLVLILFINVSRGFIGNSGVRQTRVDLIRSTLSLKSSSSSVEDLRSLINEAGQIGISVDPDLVSKIITVVDGLPQTVNPTEIKLTGTHELLFSMAKGGSNGKLGPFVGKVNQIFLDEINFINQVTLGPLKVQLLATREIIDTERIRVKFKKMKFILFGRTLKESETKGSGVWKLRYFENGLRIMDTPSLFVIREVN